MICRATTCINNFKFCVAVFVRVSRVCVFVFVFGVYRFVKCMFCIKQNHAILAQVKCIDLCQNGVFLFQLFCIVKACVLIYLWFIEFCKANFIKRRGRIGHTLKIDQEHLLFLTKLCIGDQPKIRLKTLWEEMKKRGVHFDESSKMEVVKLFEKINLIEKKSDSGDAQYVRTIL